MNEQNAFTRRVFLQKGLTIVSTAATVPYFVQSSAFGITNPFDFLETTSIPGVPQDRILVIIQLGGGNDGLNTVIPFGDANYYRARPSLGIPQNQVLRLTERDGIGLHPNLGGFKEMYDNGGFAAVQGVGYPNPNRSHFTSTDIWESGLPAQPSGNGWVGRYFDCTCNGTPDPNSGIAIGRAAPKAMIGELVKPVSFETAELFRWIGSDLHESLAPTYDELNRAGDKIGGVEKGSQLEFLTRTSLDAQIASDKIRNAVRVRPLVEYPRNNLANQLQMIAAMIRAELPTRVYYASISGFDTHAGQANTHANLMTQMSSAILAFQNDLKAQGNDTRTLTMTFSEFGRRVKQNGSAGTDHGTAAPMFLFGPMVRAGILGDHPSLTDLDTGDLKFNVDFRCIYAAILEDWLKADSKKILKGAFRTAKIFNKTV